MLPRHHYSEKDCRQYSDSKWIELQLEQLPISMQAKVSKRYSDIYWQLSEEDPRKCRFRANSWLREVVKKHKVTVDIEV